MTPGRSIFFRAGLALGVSFAAAVLAAIGLAVFDIYVTGHGQPSILRSWIDWPGAGVHVSRGDAVMYFAACFAGLGTWLAVNRRP
jgi:hypothetical protein